MAKGNHGQGNVDNMAVRKKQLEQLDAFVKGLYDDCKALTKYSGTDFSDLEMLYMHIHELIEEMLQVKTTDEFMDMMKQLHQAIAGVLIVVAGTPDVANQVKQDMQDSYQDFEASNLDDFVDNLQKTSMNKYGNKKQKRNWDKKDPEEEVENDPDDLVDTLDLKDHVTKDSRGVRRGNHINDNDSWEEDEKPKKRSRRERQSGLGKSDDNGDDPMSDVYNEFN